ncbi:MAG: prolyl-tRNA synthetase associated domain-containing protein [Parcubacteria group bacterium]|nr:prolyl-tRNA synthetase associated domain-containing protein [Parcubacteria group bacterium]
MESVFKLLDSLEIEYTVYEHPAVFTVNEARQCEIELDFGETKNLFLRNKKGDKHFLVVIEALKQLDLKKLGNKIGEKNISFASPERLLKHLGLTPGSVSPFGLINNIDKNVVLIIDQDLLKNEMLGFHPNINTRTIVLKTEVFLEIMNSLGYKILVENL